VPPPVETLGAMPVGPCSQAAACARRILLCLIHFRPACNQGRSQ
jgi:hypothetical protein